MKVGIINRAYTNAYGFERGVHLLREAGFECMDYQDFANTDLPMYRLSDREFEVFLRKQRSAAESEGVIISQTHGPWRWPVRDSTPEERAERFEKMTRAIHGTAFLGCRNFVIHPVMPYGWQQDPEPEKFRAVNMDFMGRLTEIAEADDVVICFENMPMPALSLASPESCRKFAGEIGSSHFRVCLDTGHCTMLNVNPADAVRTIGKDFLQVLHVHDNDGHQDLHWVPFTGVIDWDDFGKALQEIGFDGTVSLETTVPAHFTGESRKLQEKSLFLSAMQIAGRSK